MLNNFFRINMPYGIAKNENGEWMAFSREYMPLGYNNIESRGHLESYKDQPIYAKYKGLTDKFIEKIVEESEFIHRDSEGNIVRVFFYNDATNPSNGRSNSHWAHYFDKIKGLSKLEKIK